MYKTNIESAVKKNMHVLVIENQPITALGIGALFGNSFKDSLVTTLYEGKDVLRTVAEASFDRFLLTQYRYTEPSEKHRDE